VEATVSAETLADEMKPKKGVSDDDTPSRWRFGLRHMLHAVFYCAIFCWLVASIGVPVIVLLFAAFITIFLAFALLFARRRSAQRETLLALLALAVDREMPLGPTFDAVSDQFTGEFRRRVRALAHYANSGLPLPDALDREPGSLPADAEIIARVGYEAGTLSRALRECTASRVGFRPIWTGVISRILYFLFLLCVIQGICGFLLYFVVPRFDAILRDFGMQPPPPLRLLIELGRSIVAWAPLYLLTAFLQVALLLTLPLAMLGWMRIEIPLVQALFKRWHTALVLRGVSWAVEGGVSMPRTFEILSDWYPQRKMRERLARVLLDVRHGTDWLASLRHHGLIGRADAAVLEAARRVGNLPWALRETAEGGERRIAYRLEAFQQLLVPIVVVAFGGLVGLIVVSYLAPLITIIERLV
jgi:type II secretory pathway component PulF